MLRGCVIALLLLPLSGCLGGQPPALTVFQVRGTLADDPTPLPVPDCDVLLEALNERALEEARAALRQAVEGGYYGHGIAVDMAAADGDATFESSTARTSTNSALAAGGVGDGRKATGTNNQEQGADEGDIVKTDGSWTYVLTHAGDLYVLAHHGIGDVAQVARMPLGGGWGGAGHLLLVQRDVADPADDRLVAVLPSAQLAAEEVGVLSSPMRDRAASGMTRVLVLDLADRAAPAIVSETFVEGHVSGVRLIDGVAHVVVQRWAGDLGLRTWPEVTEDTVRLRGIFPDGWFQASEASRRGVLLEAAQEADRANRDRIARLTLRDHLPLVLASSGGTASPEPLGDEQCRQVLATPGPTGRAVSTVLSLDAAGDLSSKTVQVLGASAIVYASPEALVLAAPTAEAWWASAQAGVGEASDLHWFDLEGLDVTHRASGRVAGSILDSFAIDVREDRLRVATTLNTWSWVASAPMVSQVVVLDPVAGALVPAGSVGGIAPTERIWSVRFTDDRVYLVTFRNMDPLWVVDLSGTVPALLGELEIPGVSTYLHPVDDRTLLAIGHGPAGEDGLGLDWGSVQLSLFDLSDLANPRRADVLDLATGGQGSSAATHEHKAFTYWPEVGRLAVPLTTWRHDGTGQDATLQVVAVDPTARTLTLSGAVNQTQLPPAPYYGGDIERSFFLGVPPAGPVSLFAISQRGITGHDLATLQPQGGVAFEQAQPQYHYID